MNNVTNWVFDLDNTLYKAECGLFDKVHVLMGRYIEEKLGLASGEARLFDQNIIISMEQLFED